MKIHFFAAFLLAALTLSGFFHQGSLHAEPAETDVSPAGEAEPAETPVSEYLERMELRSLVRLPGGIMFSLRDPLDDTSFWIEAGQTRNGLEVVGFDDKRNRLTLRHDGAVRTLSLSSARIQALPEAATRPEVAEGTRRERGSHQREEIEAFLEKWQTVARESEEIREIEDHFREVVSRIQRVNNALGDTEEGSENQERLVGMRNELRQEFALLQRHTARTLNDHPEFGEFDPRIIPQVIRATSGFQQEGNR